MAAMSAICISNRVTPFSNVLQDIPLEPLKKQIIMARYNALVLDLEQQTLRISVFFHTSRCIITVGSLIVPALLSIQYTNGNTSNLSIYWTTWVVSLLVTVCNGLSTLLKLDKNYYHLHTVREQLISDGWQYAELTGKYSGFHTPHRTATHENQFVFFSHSIEKIRMQQIQEEYFKVADPHGNTHGQHAMLQAGSGAEKSTILLPPTPQQGELGNLPLEMQQAIAQVSQTTIVDAESPSNKEAAP
jgi:hypothetical protein